VTTPTPLLVSSHIEQHLAADAASGALALADFVGSALADALRERGRAGLLVSGGRSPIPFFAALSQRELDWAQVTVSLVDERCVPSDSEASNARLVREHLLQNAAAAANFIPLYRDDTEPDTAAALAEQALAAVPAPFDVAVLGMGDDGHTASLFPGARGTAAGLDPQQPRRVVATWPTTAPHARLSLTLRALLETRTLVLAIAGETKRAVLEHAADSAPEVLPIAAFVRQQATPLHLFFSA
jgi:6-phosphogluconolactonase